MHWVTAVVPATVATVDELAPDLRPDPRPDPRPSLLLLADPEARFDPGQPVLGRTAARRLTEAALDAGFGRALAGPGVGLVDERLEEVAAGDEVEGPVLVLHEGTLVDPRLLQLMVEHPLEEDERYSLYDAAERPAAWFSGSLGVVPAAMPVSEEIPWPEGVGPEDVVRLVYDSDLERAEWLVLRDLDVLPPGASDWNRRVAVPTLRALASSDLGVAQLELLALLASVTAGLLALLPGPFGPWVSALILLAGVHVARLLRALRHARGDAPWSGEGWIPGETLSRATRPLAHAFLTATLTYVLVAKTGAQSGVAALVLLATGGAGTMLSLLHARSLLRRELRPPLELPRGEAVFARVDLPLPSWLEGSPLIELMVLAASLPGIPALPWGVLVSVGVARLWRWFAGAASLGPVTDPEAAGGAAASADGTT